MFILFYFENTEELVLLFKIYSLTTAIPGY